MTAPESPRPVCVFCGYDGVDFGHNPIAHAEGGDTVLHVRNIENDHMLGCECPECDPDSYIEQDGEGC